MNEIIQIYLNKETLDDYARKAFGTLMTKTM